MPGSPKRSRGRHRQPPSKPAPVTWRALEFKRTSVFDRIVKGWLSDDQERVIEQVLLANPEAGAVIPGTGGARKLRLALPGRGKSSGARVIYLYVQIQETIHLLLIYAKSGQEDLTPEQQSMVRAMVAALKGEK